MYCEDCFTLEVLKRRKDLDSHIDDYYGALETFYSVLDGYTIEPSSTTDSIDNVNDSTNVEINNKNNVENNNKNNVENSTNKEYIVKDLSAELNLIKLNYSTNCIRYILQLKDLFYITPVYSLSSSNSTSILLSSSHETFVKYILKIFGFSNALKNVPLQTDLFSHVLKEMFVDLDSFVYASLFHRDAWFGQFCQSTPVSFLSGDDDWNIVT